MPVDLLTTLIAQNVDAALLFDETKKDMGLFVISFTQFCRVMLTAWRKDVEQQMKTIQRIFVESDANNDGVLDLNEFTHVMRQMAERERALDVLNLHYEKQLASLGHEGHRDCEEGRQPAADASRKLDHQRRQQLKMRNLRLFNEALDLSIDKYIEQEVSTIDRGEHDTAKHFTVLRALLREDEQIVDKLDPMAFTQVIMQRGVGGFGLGNVMSDLRFTLWEM